MKKLLIGFFVFFVLFSAFTSSAQASCVRRPTYGCPAGNIQCSLTRCCTTQAECPSPAPTVPSADVHGKCDLNSIDTAIGCVSVLSSQEEFLGGILKWGVGIGGGIAFLLIIYAGFMVMTSAGDPERLKAGQELLTSAISGLILLIFSIFILNFIGIDLLGLDKFGFGKP